MNSKFDAKLAPIASALRERMRFYKLRVTPNAVQIANSFNERFDPEIIADYNDPFRIEWMLEPKNDIIIGEEVTESYLLSIYAPYTFYIGIQNIRPCRIGICCQISYMRHIL